MQELFEQLSWHLPEPRYHRVKFFPLDETLEVQLTTKLAVPESEPGNGSAAQQAMVRVAAPDVLKKPGNGSIAQQAALQVATPDSIKEWRNRSRAIVQQPTIKVTSPGGVIQPGGRSTFAGAGHQSQAQKNGFHPSGSAAGRDDGSEFDNLATIPVVVLKNISKQQASPAPAIRSEISEVAGSAAYVGIGNIGGSILKYGSNVLIQRGFGAGAFGLYTLGMSVVGIVTAIFNLGLDDAMVRYVSIYRARRKIASMRGLAIFCTALAGASGILGALFMLFTAPFLASVKHSPELTPILVIMSPMVPFVCMQNIWISGLQGFKDFKWRMLLQRILMPIVLILLLIGAIIFFHNLNSIIIATVIYGLISAVFSFYFFFRRVAGVLKPEPEIYELRDWFGFAAPNFLTSIIDTVLQSIDTLLLAFFAISNVAIGQYAAAIKISGNIVIPQYSFNAMFAPMIAELHSQGEHQKLTAMFQIVTKWSITFSLPIFWIATIFSVPLLGISGTQFIPAWPLVIAFSIGTLINVATGSVGYLLLMTGYTKISFLNSLTAVVVDIIVGVILTPRYGAMGVAIATGAAVSVANLMRLLQVRFLLKMQPYRLDVLKPVFAGLISALLTGWLLYLLDQSQLTLQISHFHVSVALALVPVFLAIYTGLLILFKVSPEDKVVLDMLRKKLKRGKKNKNKKR